MRSVMRLVRARGDRNRVAKVLVTSFATTCAGTTREESDQARHWSSN